MFAVVLLTLLDGVAHALTLKGVNEFDFLFTEKHFAFGKGVVHLVTLYLLLRLPTNALVDDHFFAAHTVAFVTSLDALVLATREEAFAEVVASGDWLVTRGALSAQQRLNRGVATGAEAHAGRVTLACAAFPSVTRFRALVISTRKRLSTHFFA